MRLSAVIVTKNRPRSVQRCLDSLQRQSQRPDEVILVNDGGEALKLNPRGLNVLIVDHVQSVGSGRARNVGVQRSSGSVILLLDDDVELITESFIENGLKMFAGEKQIGSRVGIVFPRKLDVVGVRTFELSFFKENRLTGELEGAGQEARSFEAVSHGLDSHCFGEILGPMVAFVRREAFEDVGGYDFIFGWGRGHSFREESDFQLRVQEKGWRAEIRDDIFFKHHIQPTGGHGTNLHKKLFWIGHNQAVFSRRHQKWGLAKTLFFTGLELPRYAWGNGRFLTYPAGVLGVGAGLATSVFDFIKSKSRRK